MPEPTYSYPQEELPKWMADMMVKIDHREYRALTVLAFETPRSWYTGRTAKGRARRN